MNYCDECGAKLENNPKFCPECGTKLKDREIKNKYCPECGEKIRNDEDICQKCKDKKNQLSKPVKENHNTILTARNLLIVFAIIIIIGIISIAPTVMDFMAPYKEVDSSYIVDRVPDEKVQFDGEYIGTLSSLDFFSIMDSEEDYVFKVGDEYVFVHGEYSILSNNEGKTFHLEGRFPEGMEGEISTQLLGNNHIKGYWFKDDSVTLIG